MLFHVAHHSFSFLPLQAYFLPAPTSHMHRMPARWIKALQPKHPVFLSLFLSKESGCVWLSPGQHCSENNGGKRRRKDWNYASNIVLSANAWLSWVQKSRPPFLKEGQLSVVHATEFPNSSYPGSVLTRSHILAQKPLFCYCFPLQVLSKWHSLDEPPVPQSLPQALLLRILIDIVCI